jgi:hypothetical protein
MSRGAHRGRHLRLLALTAVAVLWLGPATMGARAASLTTDCVGLQAALDQAQSGDTITLNQLCTKDNSGASNGQFLLNSGSNDSRSYTLTGQPGSGAGFDGTGVGARMLSATNTSGSTPTATLTVNNLVFQNGNSAGANGGALQFDGDYVISLSGDTFSNNQASSGGTGGALSYASSATSSQMTLNNDTFTGNLAAGGVGGAVDVQTSGPQSMSVAMNGDTFTGNQTQGGGSGGEGGAVELELPVTAGSVTVTNSTFRNNATQTSGGGLDIFSPFVPIPVTLTGNTFAGNSVNGCGCGSAQGGGVAIFSASTSPPTGTAPITQTGNTFSGNSVTGSSISVAGGGEAIGGDTLTSTGDVFTQNTLSAPGSGDDAEGAGLSIQTDCDTSTPQHQATNLVLAGNSIGDGGAGSPEGALSTSCGASTSGQPTSLKLVNSTISGNRGGGGTAGINGESIDQLTLQNTILTGNSDGADLGGFGASSVAATYTDLCSGASPFPGTGNICAPPALANPPAGDVHETSSSPTIDAGSNSLVPPGVNTDVYGAARIQPRVAGNPPVVDMGAAEFPAIPLAPSASISVPAAGGTYAQGQVVSSSFTCTEGTGGPGISSCLDQAGHASGAAIDTAKPGPHTFTVTATSSDGKTGTKSVSYTVAGAPTVSIANPGSGAVYTLHHVVRSSFSCTEGPSGPGIKSCTDQNGNGPGQPLNTSSNGVHQLTVTATSADGQQTTQTVSYRVRLPSNHLLAPIRFKGQRNGVFIVNVKVPGPGVVHVLLTAWENNIAGIARVLNPAPKRFVFGRGIARPNHKGWVRIVVRPNPFGRQLLANPRYRITLRLWVSYIPKHGNQRDHSFYGLHLPTSHG